MSKQQHNKRLTVYIVLACSTKELDERILGVYLTKEGAEQCAYRIKNSHPFYVHKRHVAVLKQKLKGDYSLYNWPNVTLGMLRMPKRNK